MTAEEARKTALSVKRKFIEKDDEAFNNYLLEIDTQIEEAASNAELFTFVVFNYNLFNYPNRVLNALEKDLVCRGFSVAFTDGNVHIPAAMVRTRKIKKVEISWEAAPKFFTS